MTEQQTAPARAKREYRARPDFFSGVTALTFSTMESTLVEPVLVPDILVVFDGEKGLERRGYPKDNQRRNEGRRWSAVIGMEKEEEKCERPGRD